MKKLKDNKTIRLILLIVKAITTLVICGVVSIIFVQRISNNKLTLGGYSIFTIISESMLPKYEIGDMLISKKVNPGNIKIGDDVVYIGTTGDFKDKIVTHRVINITGNGDNLVFTTKGLANDVEDPDIKQEQIYGVIAYKTKILSLISRVVNNTYGFYFMIFIPFAIMIALEIIDVINDKKNNDEG